MAQQHPAVFLPAQPGAGCRLDVPEALLLGDAFGLAVFGIDQQGLVTGFGARAQELFGYTLEEVQGRHVSLFSQNGRDMRLATLIRHSLEQQSMQHAHLDAAHKDGHSLFLSVTVVPACGSGGIAGGAVALATDIESEREEYEKLKRNTLEVIRLSSEIRQQSAARQMALDALEELSGRLQGVLSAASQVVIVATSPGGVISVFNSGAQNLLGYSEDEMVGVATPLTFLNEDEVQRRSAELAMGSGHAPAGMAVLAALAQEQAARTSEWSLVRKDGGSFAAEVALSTIRGPQGVEGYLLVGVDISARRQAEEALRLYARQLEEQRQAMERDLKAAAEIQKSLLPVELPPDGRYQADWLFEPSTTIGGDIFNILALDRDHLAVYILDVSGHGVSSALVAAAAAQALQIGSRVGFEASSLPAPDAVMVSLDQQFPLERFDRYFSLVYLVLNLETGEFRYCNAGHPPPLLVRGDSRVELLDVGGTVVGLGGIMPFEQGSGMLNQGDMLLFYTDGVSEFEDAQGASFGADRLRALVSANCGLAPENLMRTLRQSIDRFGRGRKPQDDLSALCLKRIVPKERG